jgi:hypothetical protein
MQDGFDSVCPGIAAKEHWRFVAFDDKRPAARAILLASAVKTLDRGM